MMAFVLKTETLVNVYEEQEVEIIEPAYYGGRAVAPGVEAFVWFSGTTQRLAWSAEVVRVDPVVGRRIPLLVHLITRARPDALGIAELRPYRNVRDGSALAGLSRKLFFHAHDKIATLTSPEADLLRSFF
jgi:hypothetical protein